MDLEAIFVGDEQNPILNGIVNAAIELAEPLHNELDEIARERNQQPRNANYYEETIPRYMGDLFIQHFRMSRERFEELMNVIGNNNVLVRRTIPVHKIILFTIWVLTKPESFLAAGDRFGISRSTAHEIFKEAIGVVVSLMGQYIRWPDSHNEAIRIFHERSQGFPGVIGAVDGCHIPIKQPRNNPHDYYNRKQVHSIVLQGICNNEKLFIDIYVGMPGRCHDARVFRTSPVYNRIMDENNPLIVPELHIVGDTAYSLMQNVLTPFRDNGHLNEDEIRYNIKLSSIRSVIERAFGLLKGKFRRLKYLDVTEPEFGVDIIAAACVLHNFIIQGGEDHLDEMDEQEEVGEDNENPQEERRMGLQKRNDIVTLLRNN